MKALEEQARELAGNVASGRIRELSIPSMLRKEIALVVEQIDQLRELRKRQLRKLLRVECYMDTELMQLKQRMPRYAPHQFPEKEKLQQRLFNIERLRQDMDRRHLDIVRNLEDRLLDLLNKHEQLDI